MWSYSAGQSNQSVCHSWLVSPVVTRWISCGGLGIWGIFLVVFFVWFCGFVWFWFVCLLAGGTGITAHFLLKLCIPLVCPFCWTNSTLFPGSSQHPLQSYIPGFGQFLLLQTAQNIGLSYKHKQSNFTIILTDKEELSPPPLYSKSMGAFLVPRNMQLPKPSWFL